MGNSTYGFLGVIYLSVGMLLYSGEGIAAEEYEEPQAETVLTQGRGSGYRSRSEKGAKVREGQQSVKKGRRGDRQERRMERRGDRQERRLERRDDHQERRMERRDRVQEEGKERREEHWQDMEDN